jgi:hypothetical protein
MYTYEQLDEETLLTLLSLAKMEINKNPAPELPEEASFLSRIVRKRIEAMKLPINFTEYAYIAINLLVDRPGSAIILLIDTLNKYEGQIVTIKMLAELYPMGFYDEASLIKVIDEEIKPRKRKWSEIY